MSSLTDFLKGIANAIRKKKGTTEVINAQNFATEIENLPSGSSEDITTVKKLLDATKNSSGLFKSSKLTDVSSLIAYSDTENVTNMEMTFYFNENLTTIPLLDTRNATNMSNIFANCGSLTTIPQLDTSKVTRMDGMFYNCTSLITIPQLDTSKVTEMSSMFNGCSNIIEIPLLDIRNVGSIGASFQYCSKLTNIKLLNINVNYLSFYNSTKLTLESLLGICQECINVNANRTLTVGSANLKKLANIYVKLADNPNVDETVGAKLPFVQCEQADEGAMLIADYMALKMWKLA